MEAPMCDCNRLRGMSGWADQPRSVHTSQESLSSILLATFTLNKAGEAAETFEHKTGPR